MGFETSLGAFNISGSGMSAERLRMEVVANNIANAGVTRTPEGGPYRRRDVVFETALNATGDSHRAPSRMAPLAGVRAVETIDDRSELPRVYNPGHPDADIDGFVTMSNVSLPIEMVNLITATRAYEANTTSLNAIKQEFTRALDVLR